MSETQEQISNDFQITFTLDEVNQILNALGEIPAKLSLPLIGFIKQRAEQQVQAAAESGETKEQ